MTRTVVVDAHILLWFLEDSPKLSNQVADVLADPEARLIIPAIALAEAFWAVRKKKTMVTSEELKQAIAMDPRILVVPLDLEIVEAAQQISGDLEMHDCIIIATTARHLQSDPQTVLLCDDHQIRHSKLVPVLG